MDKSDYSVVSKVYTHIINSRLTAWAESNFVLTDAQAGFRKGQSTIDHIFTSHAAIEKQFANNSKLYVEFLDFKKAYDTVNRNILWSVLFHSGIQGKMHRNLKVMYSSIQACVMSKGEVSDSETGVCGKPSTFISADKRTCE